MPAPYDPPLWAHLTVRVIVFSLMAVVYFNALTDQVFAGKAGERGGRRGALAPPKFAFSHRLDLDASDDDIGLPVGEAHYETLRSHPTPSATIH
ncbi:hypothetical protein BH11PSE2_BH11PSE2_09520 [soil metagenome]